jgi:hypothetical protein
MLGETALHNALRLGTEDIKASKNGSVNSTDSSTIREWKKELLLKINEDYKPNKT